MRGHAASTATDEGILCAGHLATSRLESAEERPELVRRERPSGPVACLVADAIDVQYRVRPVLGAAYAKCRDALAIVGRNES